MFLLFHTLKAPWPSVSLSLYVYTGWAVRGGDCWAQALSPWHSFCRPVVAGFTMWLRVFFSKREALDSLLKGRLIKDTKPSERRYLKGSSKVLVDFLKINSFLWKRSVVMLIYVDFLKAFEMRMRGIGWRLI